MDLPLVYLDKMKSLLQHDYESYIDSFKQKNFVGIRVNTLKISVSQFKKLTNFDLEPVSWCDTGFYYNNNTRPAKSYFYNAGLFYIQEPSAMSTASVIPIEPDDKVLDICAAPGGKSTQIACKLSNKGVLVSNDISTSRCRALAKNIELFGIKNAIITNETPKNLSQKFKGYFNKIIVDAPCSGEGMFRKDKDSIKAWSQDKIKLCCNLQKEILFYAKEMLDFGGIIAYSTCTFEPKENEQIINQFLNENPEFELLDFDKTNGFENGKSEWVKDDFVNKNIHKCGRLWPHKVNGEGHFLALLKKTGQPKNIEIKKIKSIDKKFINECEQFFKKNLNISLFENLLLHKTSLFSVPKGIDLSGLRVFKSGFYLGDVKTKRFAPSQSLAMALKKDDAKFIINFNINDLNLTKYLKGESFKIDCDNDGWHLVCLKGYPIGWAKVQNKRLKNKYLASWINN